MASVGTEQIGDISVIVEVLLMGCPRGRAGAEGHVGALTGAGGASGCGPVPAPHSWCMWPQGDGRPCGSLARPRLGESPGYFVSHHPHCTLRENGRIPCRIDLELWAQVGLSFDSRPDVEAE